MTPMEFLSGAGYVLDSPGSWLRAGIGNLGDLITGQDRTGSRASGREMLEAFGLGKNKDGIDPGDVAGFLAEMVLDPLNLVPFGAIAKAAKAGRAAKTFNAGVDDLIKAGGMPAELAGKTAIGRAGVPMKVKHGTPYVFPIQPDMDVLDADALFGRGYYTTEDIGLPMSRKQGMSGEEGLVTGGVWDDAKGEYKSHGYVHKGMEDAPAVYPPIDLKRIIQIADRTPAILDESVPRLTERVARLQGEYDAASILDKPDLEYMLDDAKAALEHVMETKQNALSLRSMAESAMSGPKMGSEAPVPGDMQRLASQVGQALSPLSIGKEEGNLLSRELRSIMEEGSEGVVPLNVRQHYLYSEKPFVVNPIDSASSNKMNPREFEGFIDPSRILSHTDRGQYIRDESHSIKHILKRLQDGRDLALKQHIAPGMYADEVAASFGHLGIGLRDQGGRLVPAPVKGRIGYESSGLPAGIENPFNVLSAQPDEDIFRLGETADKLLSARAQKLLASIDNLKNNALDIPMEASELWRMIDPMQISPQGEAMRRSSGKPFGNTFERNDVLKYLGYDSILHNGGWNPGFQQGISHNVAIGLDPNKVFGPWIAPPKRPIPNLIPDPRLLYGVGAGNLAQRFGGLSSQQY